MGRQINTAVPLSPPLFLLFDKDYHLKNKNHVANFTSFLINTRKDHCMVEIKDLHPRIFPLLYVLYQGFPAPRGGVNKPQLCFFTHATRLGAGLTTGVVDNIMPLQCGY